MDKITWKVAPEPTGRYRSFEKRGWPTAYWPGDVPCAHISCESDYTPARARGEQVHAELHVWVAIALPDSSNWDNRRLKQRATSLAQAKQLVEQFFTAYPEKRYTRK